MKDQIDNATSLMLNYYGDSASKEFYAFLKEKRFRTTKCGDCGETPFPPRAFCPTCFSINVTWIDMPNEATLYAFTTQERSLRFPPPQRIGLVEIEGIGVILSHILGKYEELSIGRKLKLDFIEISDDLTLHCYALDG